MSIPPIATPEPVAAPGSTASPKGPKWVKGVAIAALLCAVIPFIGLILGAAGLGAGLLHRCRSAVIMSGIAFPIALLITIAVVLAPTPTPTASPALPDSATTMTTAPPIPIRTTQAPVGTPRQSTAPLHGSQSSRVSQPVKPAVGAPFRVVTRTGAAADVTIVNIAYPTATIAGRHPVSGDEYAVLNVQITGESTQPFYYSERNFAIRGADDGPDPYFTYVNTPIWNVDPSNWAAFPPWLNSGSVTKGQQIRGTVPFEVYNHSREVISMSEDDLTTTLAQWLIATA